MTTTSENSQVQENKSNDKELNFRALQSKYEKQLAEERAARLEAERIAQDALSKRAQPSHDEEEDDDEPYVDKKKLEKKLSKFGQSTQGDIQKAMEMAKQQAKEELKQEMWLDNNPDFYAVLEHADKFAEQAPELAKSILKMPDGFERQKLVYQNIKHMKMDQPAAKQSTVQDKIDANKRSPYYQPSGVGAAPYASAGDFSSSGQKQSYEKMKELQARLRL